MAYRVQRLGFSHQGREIKAHLFGDNPEAPLLLVLGGTHGDERATVVLLEKWVEDLQQTPPPEDLQIIVLPCLNPDGYAANTRVNGRGVDINRNFPAGWSANSEEPPGPHPLSEIESRILHDWVLAHEPAAILSLHWALAEIDGDGEQSLSLVQAMWQALPQDEQATYRWRLSNPFFALESVAGSASALPKPTTQGPPGSFGRWAGYAIPCRPGMVTVELPYRPKAALRPDPLPEDHLSEVVQRWTKDPEKYIRDTYAGLCAMFAAACYWIKQDGMRRA